MTVSESMKLLSPEHREILVLVCVQGMRYEEASELLQIPVGTVRSRLSRARKQLQDLLTSPPDGHPLGLAQRGILPGMIPPPANTAWQTGTQAA
jgi:RNA polymerase sigma-70 factor (ECF subfamily)